MSTQDIHSDRILILDFGSQYTQLIARRVREAGVYSEIHPWDMNPEALREFAPSGIILSGGPESVIVDNPPRAHELVFELGVPVLGICYGMQTMAAQLGGRVESADHREFGYAQVRARGHTRLLTDIEDHTTPEGYGLLDVWMSHGDRVTELPPGFKLMAIHRFRPHRRHGRRGTRLLRRAVPPGGDPHQAGHAHPVAFPARDLRL
jgi:GMP synthase (glutamine-hydrolysing)